MTDVPCHSWIVPTLLAHAGIEFLHIGTNSGSSDPRVPLLHFREGPDGSRVLTMHVNGYGTGYMPPDDWPYRTWLGLIHTGDNHGPPRPDEVRQILDEISQRMPDVKVRIGRLSDFADGYEQSLLYGEHTWGASLGWVGHALPWGADWQKQTDERHRRMIASWNEHSAYADEARAIGASLLAGQLQRLSQSIDSDRDRAAVYNPLPWKRDGIAVIKGSARFVRDIPPMGYRTLYRSDLMREIGVAILLDEDATLRLDREPLGDRVLQNDFFRLTYNLEARFPMVGKTIDRTRHVDISLHALIGRLSWEFMVRSRPCCRLPR